VPEIVLATLNARYVHAALGLRYLLANLGDLAQGAVLREYTIARAPDAIAADLLALQPRVVGLGVYIWNVRETLAVMERLRAARPDLVIVLGGPEVSHESEAQPIVRTADYVITGPGEQAFARLCREILDGRAPPPGILAGEAPALDGLALPYDLYTDEDIAHRLLYVEASRGCPFKCEFCLSALDKTAWPFPLEPLLAALDRLHARGARRFKFVDRTFNLNARIGAGILEFFLARMDARLFVHFEIIPDHLPEALKVLIRQFPPGALQFEVGVQTFDARVQARISRKQDNARTEANLRWLRQETAAHIHADLIAGLPGEDMASFGQGFDRLVALGPQDIQVGLLKRLKGAPIARHEAAFGLEFDPDPPYVIRQTDAIPREDMARLARFARYWEVLANSGRFRHGLPLLLGDSPFDRFMAWSDWLYADLGRTWAVPLHDWFVRLDGYLREVLGLDEAVVRTALALDFQATGTLGWPAFLRPYMPGRAEDSIPT